MYSRDGGYSTSQQDGGYSSSVQSSSVSGYTSSAGQQPELYIATSSPVPTTTTRIYTSSSGPGFFSQPVVTGYSTSRQYSEPTCCTIL